MQKNTPCGDNNPVRFALNVSAADNSLFCPAAPKYSPEAVMQKLERNTEADTCTVCIY